jgi:hypothetical protein
MHEVAGARQQLRHNLAKIDVIVDDKNAPGWG